MCGIIGMAGDLTVQHEKVARTLLILDSVRGEDSTGIAVISKWQGNVKVAKQLGDPFQLFDHKSYDKVFTGMQRAIIGHNRYATTGVVSRQNAHPFENNSVVGVHNGTLRSKHMLADHTQFAVDSENIYHHIDKYGLQDALGCMEGAWTLVWWDKDNFSINFLRNDERPLFICRSKDNKVMFWASEPWMLHASLGRHNIEYNDVFLLDKDVHHSIHIDDKGNMGKPVLRAAPSTYKPPVYQNNYRGAGPTANTTPLNPAVVAKKEEPASATPKKLEAVTPHPQYEASYLCAKQRTLETMEPLTDTAGAQFIPCFDVLRPYFQIRLYAKAGDPIWSLIGANIIGDISGFKMSGETPNRGYYKVTPHNIRILPPKEDADEEALVTITGPSGKPMNKEKFEKEYSSCAWCSSPLEFGANNKFTTAAECMCEECSNNPEVRQFVKF